MNNQLQPKEVELLRHDENPSPEKMLDFEGLIFILIDLCQLNNVFIT